MKQLNDYCKPSPALMAMQTQLGPNLDGLSRQEKAQLIAILALTVEEHEEYLSAGVEIELTPFVVEKKAYPYTTTESVDFCLVTMAEHSDFCLPDYLGLSACLSAQLQETWQPLDPQFSL